MLYFCYAVCGFATQFDPQFLESQKLESKRENEVFRVYAETSNLKRMLDKYTDDELIELLKKLNES